LRDTFFPGEVRDATRLRYRCKEEDNNSNRDAPNGQVDVEAPPPRNLFGEGSSSKGANNGGDSVDAADKSIETWPLCEGYGGRDEDISAGEDTSRAYAGNGATDDESSAVGSNGANKGSQFEVRLGQSRLRESQVLYRHMSSGQALV
jgi:hypothetical protein